MAQANARIWALIKKKLCHGQLLLTFLHFLANIGKQGQQLQLRQPVEICCATNQATLGVLLW